MVKISLVSIVVSGMLFNLSCGDKKSSNGPSDKNNSANNPQSGLEGGVISTSLSSGQLAILPEITDAIKMLRGKKSNLLPEDRSMILGQTTPESFYSAKFRVSGIGLCGESSTTDDSCKKNPWTIFNGESNDISEYNNFVPPLAFNFMGWIDFLDKESRAKLATAATYSSQHIGQYESLIVHFFRSFVIKAEIPMNDGTTIYTKKSSQFRDNGKPGLEVTYENIADGKMTIGPAEDAVFFLPNGGKTFYFQSKFEITADDVANKVPYKLILAYDPNGIIKGQGIAKDTPNNNSWLDGQVDNTNGYKIAAPFIEFAPVVARASETIMKETYMLYYAGSSTPPDPSSPTPQSAFGIRLTLYYVKEDPAQSIRGATTALVYTADTDSLKNFNTLGGLKKILPQPDGTMQFLGVSSKPILEGFKRMSNKTEIGTASGVVCLYGYMNGECSPKMGDPTAAREYPMDYTYKLLGSGEAEEQYQIPVENPKPLPTPTANPPVFSAIPVSSAKAVKNSVAR